MRKKEKLKLNCFLCGKQFELSEREFKVPVKYGRFCSAHCRSKFAATIANKDRPPRIKKNCDWCGKELSLKPSCVFDKNFCSSSCAGKFGLTIKWPNGAEKTTVTCAYCGKEKDILKWDIEQKIKRGQTQFFCDRRCFGDWKSANWAGKNHPSWKGGWTEHGSGWNEIRNVVRQEQGYKCIDCGITEDKLGRGLDIHHTIPARFFKRKADASIRSNLVGLCHRCHMKRERDEIPLFKI